jgi:hypothetical protein
VRFDNNHPEIDMSCTHTRPLASILLILTLLVSACARSVDSETVANQFIQLYFVEDNLAAAVKLASGDARVNLEQRLQQIESMGAREPARSMPSVNVALLEKQAVSADQVEYVYRVTSGVEVEGMKPITARLRLSKEGGDWRVSSFLQEE